MILQQILVRPEKKQVWKKISLLAKTAHVYLTEPKILRYFLHRKWPESGLWSDLIPNKHLMTCINTTLWILFYLKRVFKENYLFDMCSIDLFCSL